MTSLPGNGWNDPDRSDVALTRLLARVQLEECERDITETERRYLLAAGCGLRERETAFVYGVSVDSVRKGLTRARRKLRAKNTTHAVAIAIRRGLIL